MEDLVAWCEQLGAKLIDDPNARHPSAFWDDGPVIRLNPDRSEALQIIVLGHEIGHILLGHLEIGSNLTFSIHNLFTEMKWERDASAIGYLCLIPTHVSSYIGNIYRTRRIPRHFRNLSRSKSIYLSSILRPIDRIFHLLLDSYTVQARPNCLRYEEKWRVYSWD